MPMPEPGPSEGHDDFIARCHEALADEFDDATQRHAVCESQWRDRNKAALSVDRAWSVLTVKSVNAERREIEGIASTPSVDRVGDVVEPLGAQFSLPMPLLAHHDSRAPVGHVTHAKAGKDGITIKAKLAQIAEPGPLKDRIDTAWQEIKSGLVRGLSIGFKPLGVRSARKRRTQILKVGVAGDQHGHNPCPGRCFYHSREIYRRRPARRVQALSWLRPLAPALRGKPST